MTAISTNLADRAVTARGWMLLRALLSQNIAIGCSFGGFGVSMLALQERYDAGRGTVSLGLALVVLSMGLLGPLVAASAQRFGLRRTMMLGAILSGSGYAVLAIAPTMTVVLLAFGLLIGPGVALFGSLPASLLSGGWYPEARGRAVGLSNMPVLVALAPLIGSALITDHGLPAFYAALAGLHALLLPTMLGIRDAPVIRIASDAAVHDAGLSARQLLARPAFWAMALGGGTLNATGITGVAHMVAVAVERGIPQTHAALLVSVMGGASVVGSLGIGWLCDRFGGARALAGAASGFALSWAIIASTNWLPAMIPAMLVVGACGAGTFPAVNVLSARIFGLASLGPAIALFGIVTLPMTFLLPPAAGLLRDASGNYLPVIAVIVAACGTMAVLFHALGAVERRIATA